MASGGTSGSSIGRCDAIEAYSKYADRFRPLTASTTRGLCPYRLTGARTGATIREVQRASEPVEQVHELAKRHV